MAVTTPPRGRGHRGPRASPPTSYPPSPLGSQGAGEKPHLPIHQDLPQTQGSWSQCQSRGPGTLDSPAPGSTCCPPSTGPRDTQGRSAQAPGSLKALPWQKRGSAPVSRQAGRGEMRQEAAHMPRAEGAEPDPAGCQTEANK